MLIKKEDFLLIFAEKLALALGGETLHGLDLNLASQALLPVFNSVSDNLRTAGILTEDSKIDLGILKKALDSFTTMVPVFNLPFGKSMIPITKPMIDDLMDALVKRAELKEVKALPCDDIKG